jgi:hypothetical protein
MTILLLWLSHGLVFLLGWAMAVRIKRWADEERASQEPKLTGVDSASKSAGSTARSTGMASVSRLSSR